MNIIICSTPWQILNAIFIKEGYLKNEQVSVYILNYFRNSEEIARRLLETEYFEKVKWIAGDEIYKRLVTGFHYNNIIERLIKNSVRRFWKLYYYGFNCKLRKLLDISGFDSIRGIFYSYDEPLVRMMSLKVKNSKKEIFRRYEDGFGS